MTSVSSLPSGFASYEQRSAAEAKAAEEDRMPVVNKEKVKVQRAAPAAKAVVDPLPKLSFVPALPIHRVHVRADSVAASPTTSAPESQAQQASISSEFTKKIDPPVMISFKEGLDMEDTRNPAISVSVIGCTDLPDSDANPAIPWKAYCMLQSKEQTRTTKVNTNMPDPYFGEVFCFPLERDAHEWMNLILDEAMTVTIKHKDTSKDNNGDDIIGWACIPHTSIQDYIKQSRLEQALSGLSFLRPSKTTNSPKLASELQPLDILRCSEVSKKILSRRYPSMKWLPLQIPHTGRKFLDGQGTKQPGLSASLNRLFSSTKCFLPARVMHAETSRLHLTFTSDYTGIYLQFQIVENLSEKNSRSDIISEPVFTSLENRDNDSPSMRTKWMSMQCKVNAL